jgi:hypothetical protein
LDFDSSGAEQKDQRAANRKDQYKHETQRRMPIKDPAAHL